jgi:hypothetical protein
MAKLSLYRSDVAGLVDDMTSHSVPGRMRGFAADLGYGTYFVPYVVDYQWRKSANTVVYGYRRQEQGG